MSLTPSNMLPLDTVAPSFELPNPITNNNLKNAFPNSTNNERKKISDRMWYNYGKILSEYMFIKNFRNFLKRQILLCHLYHLGLLNSNPHQHLYRRKLG